MNKKNMSKEKTETVQINDFLIGKKLLWVYLILSVLLVLFGFYSNIQNHEWTSFMISSGITLFVIVWLVILLDMIKHNIYNKIFWIISMFILGAITPYFYLIMRSKLISLGNKVMKNDKL